MATAACTYTKTTHQDTQSNQQSSVDKAKATGWPTPYMQTHIRHELPRSPTTGATGSAIGLVACFRVQGCWGLSPVLTPTHLQPGPTEAQSRWSTCKRWHPASVGACHVSRAPHRPLAPTLATHRTLHTLHQRYSYDNVSYMIGSTCTQRLL
jgi:hypothetical protein